MTDLPRPPASVLCLGEAIVDLICERHVDSLMEADRFTPHFGGVTANVALLAAEAGVMTTLAGGAGADDWGRWLAERLHGAGVDTFRFRLIHGTQTPVTMVTVSQDGEAHYTLYAESAGTVAESLGADVKQAVSEHGALFISSNTLVASGERAVTMVARDAALALGRPIIFDVNLRLHRWKTRADAAASVNAALPGTMLLRASASEARLLTGEQNLERAAMALRKTGVANVVISLGADGAMLRGKINRDVVAEPIEELKSTIGCGDALTADLLARLVKSDFYEPVIAAGLKDAVAAATAACGRWGAVD